MAYVQTDRRELWIANRDGDDAHRVAAAGEGVAAPRWLPDGRHLLFVRDGRVWLLDATGAARRWSSGSPRGRSDRAPAGGTEGIRRGSPSDLSPDLAEQLYSVAP